MRLVDKRGRFTLLLIYQDLKMQVFNKRLAGTDTAGAVSEAANKRVARNLYEL